MFTRFNGCGMIAVLPKRTFAFFSDVLFLGGAAGDQLDGFRQRFPSVPILNKEVDMIRCHVVI